jgi:hypothetical protein
MIRVSTNRPINAKIESIGPGGKVFHTEYINHDLHPYRFSFTAHNGRAVVRHSWIRFGRDMDTTLDDSKQAALREYSDAHGFMIEDDQDDEDIRRSWGLDF